MLKMTRYAAAIFLIAFVNVTAFGQDLSEIAGTVRDARGGPIPDAVLQVRNEQTMFIRSTRSDESGTYFIDKLPIGNSVISR
jgi:hypothetical protein